jgi:hypothetical protein
MLTLNPEIRSILEEVNFVERYETLSNLSRENSDNFPLEQLSVEEAKQMIAQFGYLVCYDKNERFFKVEQLNMSKQYQLNLHIAISQTRVELIWECRYNDKVLLGLPWGACMRQLTTHERRVAPPRFSDRDNLEIVLKEAFGIFDHGRHTPSCQR